MDDNQKELFGFIKSKLTDLVVGKQNFSQLFLYPTANWH